LVWGIVQLKTEVSDYVAAKKGGVCGTPPSADEADTDMSSERRNHSPTNQNLQRQESQASTVQIPPPSTFPP
jgi:hypothetical protein